MEKYFILAGRIITIIPAMLGVTLLMGKRHVGELPVFDFIIVLVIGAVVGADIADPSIHHGPTILALILLAVFQLGVSHLKLRSLGFRRALNLEPTIIIQNGRLLKHNLRQARYSVDQVAELLRVKNIFSFSEVEYALIESNGELSVLKKILDDTPKARDLHLDLPERSLPSTLIYEGHVDHGVLQRLNRDISWLEQELRTQGVSSPQEVFYAELDTKGKLYVSLLRPRVDEEHKLV